MESLAFVRIVVAFAAFYLVIPLWARGGAAARSPAGWASTFVRFGFFVETAVVLLGIIGLALPGALLVLCALWLAIDVAQRERDLLGDPDLRRKWLIRRLSLLRNAGPACAAQIRAAWRNRARRSALPWLLPVIALVAKALFPIHNVRFTDIDDYSRSLSLAVLSNGHDWLPDLSVPLLLPLQHLAAVTAPRAVALSEPLFAALLVAAVGFAVFQLRGCRLAAVAAMSCAVFLMLSPLTDGVGGLARAELAVALVTLALGLRSESGFDALLSLALGIAVGFTPGHIGMSAQILIPYASCVLLGIGIAEFRIRLSTRSRRFATAGVTASLFLSAFAFLNASSPDGPIQYEEAARIAGRLAAEQPRNTWALVSTTQELPYVYGSGWHVEMARFVTDTSNDQVTHPSYRFPFPVRVVYFLVETQPLIPYGSDSTGQGSLQVRVSPTPSTAYGTPLERASLEFKLADLLSAYRQYHDDMEIVHRTANLVLFRAPGSLRDEDQ